MPTQNAYNNYIKRKTNVTQPINNFKEKVKNSLGGVATNNTYNTPIVNTTTPSVSYSKPIQSVNNINTQSQRTVGSITPTTPQNTQPKQEVIQQPTQQPIQQAVIQPKVEAVDVPTQANQPTTDTSNNTGLMSLSEINDSYKNSNTQAQQVEAISTPISEEEIQDVANSPMVRSMARSTNKTPQQMAQELLEQQKAQLQKDYELKQQEINQQKEQAQNSFNQSKVDAENSYNQSIDKINLDRYNRQQELNTSGSRRGIQYSAQQLGLENVANINTNNNITEAGKQRNELLNKLQLQLNELNATLHLSSQQALNDYNKNLANINADYANKIMNWQREDAQIESDRKWQEQQSAADKAWQEKVEREQRQWEAEQERLQREWEAQQEALNRDWQSNENKLDRDSYKSSRSSYSSGGYSGGNYYNSRSYTPYSYSSTYGKYNTDDEITQQTIDNDFKKLSTDAYNAVDTGGIYDLMERANLYDEYTSPMYDAFYGENDTVNERLDNTRETALKHLYNKSYARSTNGSYNIGNTVYQHKSPLRQDYIDKVKSERYKTQADYYNRFSNNEATKRRANHNARTESIHNSIMESAKKAKSSKSNSKSSSNRDSNKNKTQQKVAKSVSNAKNNIKKSTTNAKNNAKTSVTKATQNTKKATTNAKNNIKTSVKKAVQNNKKATTNAKNNLKTSVKKATQNTKKSTSNASKNFKNNVKKAVSKIFKKK